MKKLFILLFILLLFPIIPYAGTVSGIHKQDGIVVQGKIVSIYSFGADGSFNITNAHLVGTTVTNSDGTWSITTTLTTPHLVIISDNNDVKKSIKIWITPSE